MATWSKPGSFGSFIGTGPIDKRAWKAAGVDDRIYLTGGTDEIENDHDPVIFASAGQLVFPFAG
jgi:hypothetical protein